MSAITTTYLLRISYDGTAYQGWQVQPNGPTVAGALQEVFMRVFDHDITMVGASRTDSGVHAYDQVARVRTNLIIDAEKLRTAWNNALPNDIVIRELYVADDAFHPHHNVAYKEYEYQIFTQRPLPMVARYGWWPSQYLIDFDYDVFEKTMQLFVGTHDFSAFSKAEPGRDPVRAVDHVAVAHNPEAGTLKVTIRAQGFVRYQIRRMVGAGVIAASATSDVTYDAVAHALTHPKEPANYLLKADAAGLCLRKIVYTEE